MKENKERVSEEEEEEAVEEEVEAKEKSRRKNRRKLLLKQIKHRQRHKFCHRLLRFSLATISIFASETHLKDRCTQKPTTITNRDKESDIYGSGQLRTVTTTTTHTQKMKMETNIPKFNIRSLREKGELKP